jgi:hypothetical protein
MYEKCQSGPTIKKVHEDGKCNCDGSVYSCLLQNKVLVTSTEDDQAYNDERKAFVPLKRSNLFQVWQLYISLYS